MKLKDTRFIIYGYGVFEIFLAQAMANDVKEVKFFRPWMGPFPRPHEQWVGKGFDWLTRVDDWEETKEQGLKENSVFCFFDVGDFGIQQSIRKAGGRVFGVNGELEMDRSLFKKVLKERGLAVPEYGVVVGTDALEKLLRKEDNLYIKLDTEARQILETTHHETWATSRDKWYYKMLQDLSCFRDITKFMWEKPIDPAVEPGSDQFMANGVSFKECLYGWELKGNSYVCRNLETDKLPSPLKKVNNALAPVWKKYGDNGAISSEIRVDKNRVPFFIDACRRMGNPPAGCVSSIYKNLAQIVEGVSEGREIKPEWNATYAAEISVEVDDAGQKAIPMELTEKDFKNVKLRTACQINGIIYNIPFPCMGNTVTKITGLGETREEAEFNCLENAEDFCTKKCKKAFYDKSAFDDLEEEIAKGKDFGLNPNDF